MSVGFERLQERLRLRGVIEAKSALRVGAGADDMGGTDLPVMRDARGLPMIPGSSLKGVLRSTLEGMLRGFSGNPAVLWTCDPLATEDREGARRACGHHAQGERSSVVIDDHCAVCRLFGSHVLASHVRIADALMSGDATRVPPVDRRDGVAIDRDFKVVAGAQKYDFEVVNPGTRFGLEVFVDNPEDWLMGLLVAGFDQLTEGFTGLGGFTSRGLGRVAIHWEDMVLSNAKTFFFGEEAASLGRAEVDDRLQKYRGALATCARGGA